ncbi:hypothetical protein LTR78_009639 [Recurvomyces mirabilis]|uniref:Uncharacterized protein n=1 Tax=Recurvomyces mirabilis TaxID=574656 RepID=A0AAE0TP71_9PEZI|nr:hypothetical protein LTR78_009639 [Recurvomyces mirabilis]
MQQTLGSGEWLQCHGLHLPYALLLHLRRAHHDAAEDPLVIDPDVLAAAAVARAEAEIAESEVLRQAKLDQAICIELQGEIWARSARAQEAHMEGVIWNQRWYEAALGAVTAALKGLELHAHLDSLTSPLKLAELHRRDVLDMLYKDRSFRMEYESVMLDFLDDHPAEADLLAPMRGLFERVSKLASDVHEMCDKWLKEHPDDRIPFRGDRRHAGQPREE